VPRLTRRVRAVAFGAAIKSRLPDTADTENALKTR